MSQERVLVGVDFSTPSSEAARWVARHFAPGAELVLAHIISFPDIPPIVQSRYPRRELLLDTLREGADKRLRELSLSLGAPRTWLEIREGEPVECLTRLAREFEAKVVVAGTHGERPGGRHGIGSTAERLVRHSEIPVLLVTNPRSSAPAHIMVAADDSTPSDAFQWAGTLSRQSGARVTAMHVASSGMRNSALAAAAVVSGSPPIDPLPPTDTAGEVDAWLQRATAGGVPRDRASSEVRFGDPAGEIIAAAARLGADLIVLGRRRAGDLRRAVLGSVVEGVLRHAPCPVLVVVEGSAHSAA